MNECVLVHGVSLEEFIGNRNPVIVDEQPHDHLDFIILVFLRKTEHPQFAPSGAFKGIGRDIVVRPTVVTVRVLLEKPAEMGDQIVFTGVQDIEHIIHLVQFHLLQTCIIDLVLGTSQDTARISTTVQQEVEYGFDDLLCITFS